MSSPRTRYGRALDDLMHRLARFAPLGLDPNDRASAVFFEIATTPCMWPLDDILYELLLATAGFDLADAHDLHGALWATALLIAGDRSYDGLWCGHDDRPSDFCALRRDADLEDHLSAVTDLAADGAFDDVYARRISRSLGSRC